MIRIEVQTNHKTFVTCEEDMDKAVAYVDSIRKDGVVVIRATYYDRDQRVQDVRDGKYFATPKLRDDRFVVLRG